MSVSSIVYSGIILYNNRVEGTVVIKVEAIGPGGPLRRGGDEPIHTCGGVKQTY